MLRGSRWNHKKVLTATKYNSSSNLDEPLKERQIKYPKIIEALDKVLYLIEEQRLSYQRTQVIAATSDTLPNPGNFLATVSQFTLCYLILYEHIHSPLRTNFAYMSPTSQKVL